MSTAVALQLWSDRLRGCRLARDADMHRLPTSTHAKGVSCRCLGFAEVPFARARPSSDRAHAGTPPSSPPPRVRTHAQQSFAIAAAMYMTSPESAQRAHVILACVSRSCTLQLLSLAQSTDDAAIPTPAASIMSRATRPHTALPGAACPATKHPVHRRLSSPPTRAAPTHARILTLPFCLTSHTRRPCPSNNYDSTPSARGAQYSQESQDAPYSVAAGFAAVS